VGVYPEVSDLHIDVASGSYSGEATRGGCAAEFDNHRMLCSFSYSAAPADVTVTLSADWSQGAIPTHEVALQAYNSCGRDIAYVELSLESSPASWSATKSINPCSGL